MALLAALCTWRLGRRRTRLGGHRAGAKSAALAVFALGSLALSQILWIISVGRLGIGLASLHINAVPFYVMLILFALGADLELGAGAGRRHRGPGRADRPGPDPPATRH